jgi:hypothetical protein
MTLERLLRSPRAWLQMKSEPDVLRLRSIPALSQIFRHRDSGRASGGIMRADHVELSWDADKSNWVVRIEKRRKGRLTSLQAAKGR